MQYPSDWGTTVLLYRPYDLITSILQYLLMTFALSVVFSGPCYKQHATLWYSSRGGRPSWLCCGLCWVFVMCIGCFGVFVNSYFYPSSLFCFDFILCICVSVYLSISLFIYLFMYCLSIHYYLFNHAFIIHLVFIYLFSMYSFINLLFIYALFIYLFIVYLLIHLIIYLSIHLRIYFETCSYRF